MGNVYEQMGNAILQHVNNRSILRTARALVADGYEVEVIVDELAYIEELSDERRELLCKILHGDEHGGTQQ